MRKKRYSKTIKTSAKKAVVVVDATRYFNLQRFAHRFLSDFLEFVEKRNLGRENDAFGIWPRKSSFCKAQYGATKKQWREALRTYKDCWITVRINPAHPELVLEEIGGLLKDYARALHILGLRRPKEIKRKKLTFPQKASSVPARILQKHQQQVKRELGKYLRDKSHRKLRMAIYSILADMFTDLRQWSKKLRLKNGKISEDDYDAQLTRQMKDVIALYSENETIPTEADLEDDIA